MPKTKPTVNGSRLSPSPEEKNKRLGELLRRYCRVEKVEISSPNYEPNGDGTDDTSSWEDLNKIVSDVSWLLPNYIPYGMLHGLIAQPKVGKSAFALGACVRPLVTGCDWFDGTPGPEPGYVAWIDTERRGAINLSRAKKWGIPLDRIKTPFLDDPLKIIDLNNQEHIDRIFDVVCRYKAKLVVVDSYRGAHKGNENDSQTASTLQNLASIGEETKAAIQLIHHTKKLFVGEDLTANAGRGSNAFLAMVSLQLALDCPDPKSKTVRLQVLGENLGTAPRPIGFAISNAGLTFGDAPENTRRQTEKDKAAEWLRQRMKPGKTYKAGEIIAEAKEHGHVERTVRKAATERLGIKPKPVRVDGKIAEWTWKLPS